MWCAAKKKLLLKAGKNIDGGVAIAALCADDRNHHIQSKANPGRKIGTILKVLLYFGN